MKTTRISELPIVPEEYALDVYGKIDYSRLYSLMADEERRFINGLIRYYQPEKILEVGVSRGSGTVNLLNAAGDAQVFSVDFLSTKQIGSVVFDHYPELVSEKWTLITGKDPSQVLDEIGIKFDFAVIDTYHFHPCETLNFISMLPFLSDGAIVVVHDTYINNHANWDRPEYFFAPRLLVSSVCGEKISPKPMSSTFSNIIAFQVTQDTRKYARNLFDILLFPWQYFDDDVVDSMRIFISKHYPASLQLMFESAVKMNLRPRGIDLTHVVKRGVSYNCDSLNRSQFEELENDTVIYGAGLQCSRLISICKKKGINFGFQVWDKEADLVESVHGIPVTLPDLTSKARPNQKLIITIMDVEISNSVQSEFEALGYSVYQANELIFTM